MKKETYKEAHRLQEEISKLVYELEVLEQNLAKPTSIRFGTNFNVSIPIEFDHILYGITLRNQIRLHKENIERLQIQFNDL